MAQANVRVDIISDTVCPWCYVGKRNLDKAMLSTGMPKSSITWRPFLLVPPSQWQADWGDAALTEGVDKVAFYDKRFGKDEWKQWQPRLEAALQNAGVVGFTMTGRTGPSWDSHRLLSWTHATHGGEKQHVLSETLFKAYFTEGKPLCNHQVLLDAAVAAGLPESEVSAVLADPKAFDEQARKELAIGTAMGVRGVPFFIIKGPRGEETVSGGQPPEVLAAAIQRVM